jgi:hypothetical protein
MLHRFAESGFKSVVVCGNGDTRRLQEVVSDHTPSDLQVIWHDSVSPRGAAGCVADAAQLLDPDHPILVAEASLFLPDLDCLEPPSDQSSGLRIYCGRPSSVAHSAIETSEPSGIYWMWPDVLAHIPLKGFFDLKEQLLPILCGRRCDIRTEQIGVALRRISTIESYLELNYSLIAEASRPDAEAGYLRSAVPHGEELWLEESCFVDPTAELVGPILLGPGVAIQKDCVVVGPTVVGAGTVIERGASVRDSILWRGVRVGSGGELNGVLAMDRVTTMPGISANYSIFLNRDTADQPPPRSIDSAGIFNNLPPSGPQHSAAHGSFAPQSARS